MASYFRQVPNFEYVNRRADNKTISDYVAVKNLFKRGKLREDIFENLTFFTKYQIIGDERPDNVAFNFYNDSTLDWVILLANNIVNIQTEWPTQQAVFDKLMLEKYGSYDKLFNGIYNYEVSEDIKNFAGAVLLKKGTILPKNWNTNGNFIKFNNSKINQIFSGNGVVSSTTVSVTPKNGILNLDVGSEIIIENVSENEYNGRFIVISVVKSSGDNIVREFKYSLPSAPLIASPTISSNNSEEVLFRSETSGNSFYYEYYDEQLGFYQNVPTSSFLKEVTNYEHEEKIENAKRNIFVLKPEYLNVIINDLEEIMPYKKGGDQYLTPTLKKGDNIRLYEY
tara:strand:+ start:892 stop:1908 length:1017 start_codon:yes stop_codon:yes gene_type:complete